MFILGPLIYIAVIAAALVGFVVALGRKERNPDIAIPGLKLKVILPLVAIIVIIPIVLLVVLASLIASQNASQNAGVDKHCRSASGSTAASSDNPKTAEELMKHGDEAFDAGNCKEAIAGYTQALALNPAYAEAYNNRAYTYMRMQNYAPALQDLDQALRIRPDYMHALMNRGDIHNYYYEQDLRKAIEDYDHILASGGQTKESSVCGHRAVAIYRLPGHEGWNVKSWFKLVLGIGTAAGCQMKAT
jgi:tetratricopeptide (TPR) repeat protein